MFAVNSLDDDDDDDLIDKSLRTREYEDSEAIQNADNNNVDNCKSRKNSKVSTIPSLKKNTPYSAIVSKPVLSKRLSETIPKATSSKFKC